MAKRRPKWRRVLSGQSTGLEITALTDTRRDVRSFVEMADCVYEDLPHRIAGFPSDEVSFLRRGPFLESGEKQLFLALRGRRAVARLSVHRSFAHDQQHGPGRGFFGFFEALDDREAVTELFIHGEAWLRGRGCREVVGPMSFGVYDEIGLLINCLDQRPAVACPYNPPYYAQLLEGLGFEKEVDWYSVEFDNLLELPPMLDRIRKRALSADGITLRPANPSQWETEGERLRSIFNEAWAENWGHVPMGRKQWTYILSHMKPAIIPNLTFFVCHNEEPVGMCITIKDVNEALAGIKRRAEWLDMANLLFRLRGIRSLRTVLMGVRDAYRNRGLEMAMIAESLERGKELGYLSCECSQVVETNTRMLRVLSRMGLETRKTWRLYRKRVPAKPWSARSLLPLSPPA